MAQSQTLINNSHTLTQNPNNIKNRSKTNINNGIKNCIEMNKRRLLVHILSSLKYARDDIIDEICKRIDNECKNHTDDEINNDDNMIRYNQITYIEKNLEHVEESILDQLENFLCSNQFLNNKEKKSQNPKEAKQKEIVLRVINEILSMHGLDVIDDLDEFREVDREVFTGDECRNIIENYKSEIFKNGFSKTDCMVYQKKLKYPHLSLVKGILKKIGYELVSKNKSEYVNRKKITKTYYQVHSINNLTE